MNKWWGFLFSLWLLSGCTPQYETRYAFTPPTSTGGLVCLKGCQAQTQSCNQQCTQQHAECSIKAEQQAKRELPERLKEYDIKLAEWKRETERYDVERRFYEMELSQRKLQRELLHLTCEREGQKSEKCFHQHLQQDSLSLLNPPREPQSVPKKPELATETARIRDLTCSKECQCDTQYQQCYTSCGGAVKPYQFCVENCPK